MDLHQEFQSSRFFHNARIDRRSAESLIGIATGLVADGAINQQEAEFLKGWIETHLAHLGDPVINILYSRLKNMLSDGVLQADEASELLDILHQFTGGPAPQLRAYTAPTTLPLNNPPPSLTWTGSVFVFTGLMAFGRRQDCEQLVVERGAHVSGTVTRKTTFLVIGSIGNEQWLNSTYGLKIKKAVELRESGLPLAIIDEAHWQRALFG